MSAWDLPPLLTVSDAAGRLGVSPGRVRQMVHSRELGAYKLGGVWVVPRASFREYAERRRPTGRPWSRATAWDVLLSAAGKADGMPEARRRRAERMLSRGLISLIGRLHSRADRHAYKAMGADTAVVREHSAAVRTGVSSCHSGLSALGEAEVYVRRSDLYGVERDAHLVPVASDVRPNVLIRSVDDDVWPFAAEDNEPPLVVVALDMLDNEDGGTMRASDQAWRILRRLEQEQGLVL